MRALFRMAMARERAEWTRSAVHTAILINRNGFTKEPVSPVTLIPPQFRPPPEPARERTPEQMESESRRAWKLLDRFCFNAHGKNPPSSTA